MATVSRWSALVKMVLWRATITSREVPVSLSTSAAVPRGTVDWSVNKMFVKAFWKAMEHLFVMAEDIVPVLISASVSQVTTEQIAS